MQTLLCMKITAYPAIEAAAAARGLGPCYGLWLILRAIDAWQGGRGLFRRDALSAALDAAGLVSALPAPAERIVARLVEQGNGVFWRATPTHVALVSRRRVAIRWGIAAREGERCQSCEPDMALALIRAGNILDIRREP